MSRVNANVNETNRKTIFMKLLYISRDKQEHEKRVLLGKKIQPIECYTVEKAASL